MEDRVDERDRVAIAVGGAIRARPVVPEAVEIDAPPVDRDALMSDLKRALIAFEPAEILRERDFAQMIDDTKDLYGELREILAEFKVEDADFEGHRLDVGRMDDDGKVDVGRMDDDGKVDVGRMDDDGKVDVG